MFRLKNIFLVFASIQFILVQSEEDCYANRTDPYLLFATKTSYFQVDNDNSSELQFPGCEAKSFWLLARHGTRNPGDDDIILMQTRLREIQGEVITNHQSGQGFLCDADLIGIERWNFTLTVEEESELTESGKLEHYQLGSRYKKRLPTILGQQFDNETFQFRHTYKKRTGDSAIAFASGAFPDESVYIPTPLDEDKILRFFDFCPTWTSEVDENPETYVEQNLFLESVEVEDTILRVNLKLGFLFGKNSPGNDQGFKSVLTFSDINLIYDMCRFDEAWNPHEPSVWCAAFEDKDLEVLEYNEELQYWYTNGYHNPLNYKMACPLMSDLVQIFEGEANMRQKSLMENGPNLGSNLVPRGTFYFTHSEAVLPFVSLLGLYKDNEGPRHDNFEAMRDRKYRTSKIGSFTNNVGMVLFECEEGAKKVLTLHQETPVKLELCDDLLCDWNQFLQAYQEDISCDFDGMCNTKQL